MTANDLPAYSSVGQEDDKLIRDFCPLVWNRLGQLGLTVLDTRLARAETKGLVGRPDLGSPGTSVIKRIVGEIRPWPANLPKGLATRLS